MNGQNFLRIFLILFLSACLSGLVYWLDLHLSSQRRSDLALRIARQVVAQTESLAQYGRERREPDPIGWAVQFLTVGEEPRVLQVIPVKSVEHTVEAEKFKFHPRSGALNYLKILSTENGTGVKIHLQLGFVGFLGTKTQFLNDLALGTVTSVFFVLLLLLHKVCIPISTAAAAPSPEHSEPLPMEPSLDHHPPTPSPWMTITTHVRNILREATRLATATAKSRETIQQVSQRSEELRSSLEQLEGALSQSKDKKLSNQFQQCKTLMEESHSLVQTALDSYGQVFEVTRAMSQHVSKTTETLRSTSGQKNLASNQ